MADIADFPRLARMGCEVAALRYTVCGVRGADERLGLAVELSGQLQLICQRCLGPVDLPLAVSNELELAESLEEIEAADDDTDRVLASRSMDVAVLVEDEAILALPMVAAHDRCETWIARGAGAQQSPFGGLAALREAAPGAKIPNGDR